MPPEFNRNAENFKDIDVMDLELVDSFLFLSLSLFLFHFDRLVPLFRWTRKRHTGKKRHFNIATIRLFFPFFYVDPELRRPTKKWRQSTRDWSFLDGRPIGMRPRLETEAKRKKQTRRFHFEGDSKGHSNSGPKGGFRPQCHPWSRSYFRSTFD